jgi:hypothetical protein
MQRTHLVGSLAAGTSAAWHVTTERGCDPSATLRTHSGGSPTMRSSKTVKQNRFIVTQQSSTLGRCSLGRAVTAPR